MDLNEWKTRYKTLTEVRMPEASKAKINKALESSQPVAFESSMRFFRGRRLMVGISAAALLLIGVLLVPTLPKKAAVLPEQAAGPLPIRSIPDLPVLGSYANLKTLLTEAQAAGILVPNFGSGQAGLKRLPNMAAFDSKSVSESAVYSSTNVQVQGVDEADIVKTDGEYIYQVNGDRVIIAQAAPPESMKIVTSIDFTSAKVAPQQLYIDKERMIVIGSSFLSSAAGNSMMPNGSWSVAGFSPTVKVMVYDIRDKSHVNKLRELELEGNYVASRKIGSALYLVANKSLNYYGILNDAAEERSPFYMDSAMKKDITRVDYANIHYFPGFVEPNYLMVAGLDLNVPTQPMQVETYLGGGSSVYASLDNLYVAVGKAVNPLNKEDQKSNLRRGPGVAYQQVNTVLYKFALANGQVNYQSQGEVPGKVLNQFSMDEDRGYLRVATTTGNVWTTVEPGSKNNVYILDKNLKLTGTLEGIAPGERIYSVRFVGDRAYMVTFKQVDPFFVIDLKNVESPKILGALKIPGYSDYLQPYDATHIIGFGKDTDNQPVKSGGTRETAIYQGMKLALFDVSDVANPKEMFKEVIGDRGTDSELLRDHKALLFDKEKNLLSFPVTVAEIKDKKSAAGGQFGEFTFQGAYVYNLDLTKGFKLQGKVTHLTDKEVLKAGRNWYGNDKNIRRIIFIGHTLYTISKAETKANNLTDLKEINTLLIPAQN